MKRRKKMSIVPAKDVPENLGDVNEYYISAAQNCMRIKYILLLLLVVFLVVMLSVYRSYITYDNLAYLLRDFGSSYVSVSAGFEDVTYDEQTNMDFTLYKGELAVSGGEKIELYNSMSSKTFEYDSEMDTPILLSSDKYLLAYDLGGKKYSLFTDVTRVFDGESESVIENAALSDKGEFILVCRARDTKYVVSYYSSSFENEVNYYKSSFVSDAALSPDGSVIAIATVDISGSAFDSVVEFYKRGEEEICSEYRTVGLMPINLGGFDDGSFYMVCDKAVLFFDSEGVFVSRYDISAETVKSVNSSADTLAVAMTPDVMKDTGTIILFDNRGNIRYNIKIDHKVTDLSHNSSYVFVLSSEKIFRYSLGEGETNREEQECSFDTQFVIETGEFALAGTKTMTKAYFEITE